MRPSWQVSYTNVYSLSLRAELTGDLHKAIDEGIQAVASLGLPACLDVGFQLQPGQSSGGG